MTLQSIIQLSVSSQCAPHRGREASYQYFPVTKDTALSVLLVPSSSLMGASLLAVQLEDAEHVTWEEATELSVILCSRPSL